MGADIDQDKGAKLCLLKIIHLSGHLTNLSIVRTLGKFKVSFCMACFHKRFEIVQNKIVR